ncbi:hypothetical protein [Sinisalibacter lacisalsi]|nr:hypothetical protein [Sinisalibacter lacisalsi]
MKNAAFQPRPTSPSATALSRALVLSLALLVPGGSALASDNVPAGYALDRAEGGLRLAFDGEIVFVTAPPERLISVNITGPHDMTGDGIANLVIYERIDRSAASVTIFSLAPEGPEVLMQSTGIAMEMRAFERITEDTDLSALLALPMPPQRETLPEPQTPERETGASADMPGFWLTQTGTWEEGFAAKMGWVVPEYSETEYATMLFRCPDNGDPYWVEPLIFHDTREEIPRRVLLELDGTPMALPVAPQMDDPRSDQWYAIGILPRDTPLFSLMAEAESIVMHYADLAPYTMTGGAAAPEQREQIQRFIVMCGM